MILNHCLSEIYCINNSSQLENAKHSSVRPSFSLYFGQSNGNGRLVVTGKMTKAAEALEIPTQAMYD